MDLSNIIGQTLDNKYQMTRELGRGGMGTVFLANHIGTERPVAVKIIAPQFMQRPEFVERFRREARAAGRLRHPNVVDVTDFGFTDTPSGRVAYLVMEYLDGCTLGEILEEEQNLPVGWTLDILEQVCSAVHEAHEQGIIHRDLKPDNIWLEPNQRGGYTVKVLDFGIAKLETTHAVDTGEHEIRESAVPTFGGSANNTFGGAANEQTIHDSISPTMLIEAAKMAGLSATAAKTEKKPITAAPEDKTAIFETAVVGMFDQDADATQLISNPDDTDKSGHRSTNDLINDASLAKKDLTRVGAVLGTPLYMSPEQCSGNRLDARSDVYSLGVIAYQMLSGDPPFTGDFSKVMHAHKVLPVPPLKAKKVRKKLKRVIDSALSKDPEMRPQTAEGFASELRSRSEGIWGLLRRALVIESEHLPKFLLLTTLLFLPSSVLTLSVLAISFMKVSGALSGTAANVLLGVFGFLLTLTSAFSGVLILGSITWIVTQYLAVPLRPVRVRPALIEAKKKWKRFAGAGALAAILPFTVGAIAAVAGFIVGAAVLGILYPLTGSVAAIFIAGVVGAVIMGVVGFLGAYINWMLAVPVVMMENARIIAAFRRSRQLARRSFATTAAAALFMFLIPLVGAGAISYVVNVSARAFDPKPPPVEQTDQNVDNTAPVAVAEPKGDGFNWDFGNGNRKVSLINEKMDMRTQLKRTLLESLIQVLMLPMQILVFSFTGIIVALLYIKTRLAGGESMQDLVERFEDDGRPRKKWQERVRQRLIQSGRLTVTSKP